MELRGDLRSLPAAALPLSPPHPLDSASVLSPERSTARSTDLSPVPAASCSSLQPRSLAVAGYFRWSLFAADVPTRLLIPRSLVRFQPGPLSKVLQNRTFPWLPWLNRRSLQYGFSTALRSDCEGALHLGRLNLPLCPLPVPIDVGRHLERRVAEVARQPSDLSAALERTLREGMSEAVECPLL